MADLPTCPDCGKSDKQRLLAESEEAWLFGCLRCVVRWAVSKPRIKERAAYEHKAAHISQVQAVERRIAARTKYFT